MNQTIGKSGRVFALLTSLLFLGVPGRLLGEVRLLPDKEIASIGVMEEPLPVDVLIRASLIASGLSGNILDARTQQLNDLVRSAPVASGNEAEDGENLLRWMHDNILTRYVESQTEMDVLLDNGRYNCVSSAVLYMILVRSRGMAVKGVLTTDHAFCRLSGIGVDVETTIIYGFDPGVRREAIDSFTGRTGFSYVPPGDYKNRRDIGEKELISLIYQNRISAFQRSGDWDFTVGLARDRWELAGSNTAKEDFRISLTNYAAEADRRGGNLDALGVIAEAVEILGPDHALGETASALLGNAVARHLRANRIDEALWMVNDENAIALVTPEFIESRRRDIADRVLENTVESADFTTAIEAVDAAFTQGQISRKRWEELVLHLWSAKARRLSSGGQWVIGWEFLLSAPPETESISRWASLLETYSHNAVVTYHNRFVNAFRRKQWVQAETLLEEGLAKFPDNATLADDRRSLEAQLNR